jgi:hypothetical protein
MTCSLCNIARANLACKVCDEVFCEKCGIIHSKFWNTTIIQLQYSKGETNESTNTNKV